MAKSTDNKFILIEQEEHEVCDYCLRKGKVHQIAQQNGGALTDICNSCIIELGRALRQHAVNNVLGIRKE